MDQMQKTNRWHVQEDTWHGSNGSKGLTQWCNIHGGHQAVKQNNCLGFRVIGFRVSSCVQLWGQEFHQQ